MWNSMIYVMLLLSQIKQKIQEELKICLKTVPKMCMFSDITKLTLPVKGRTGLPVMHPFVDFNIANLILKHLKNTQFLENEHRFCAIAHQQYIA